MINVYTLRFEQPDKKKPDHYEVLGEIFQNSFLKNHPDANFQLDVIPAPNHEERYPHKDLTIEKKIVTKQEPQDFKSSMTRKNSTQKSKPRKEEKIITRTLKAPPAFSFNNIKLEFWTNFVLNAPEGSFILLSDCDMLCRAPLEGVFWENEFDIGLTRHCRNTLPYNAGVIFVKATEKAREFMKRWLEADNLFYWEDPALHQKYRNLYAGMNQASLGYILEQGVDKKSIVDFPSSEFNAYRGDLQDIHPAFPRLVHLKSDLRKLYLEDPNSPVDNKIYNTLIKEIHENLHSGIHSR